MTLYSDITPGLRTAQSLAIGGGAWTPNNRLEKYEPFDQIPLLNDSALITATAPTLAQMALRFRANRNFEISGTNAADTDQAFGTGGGVVLTTAGADGDFVVIGAHTDTLQTSWAAVDWSTDDEVEFTALIETASSIANAIIWAGLKLTSTSTVATDAEQAFFRYEDDVSSGYVTTNDSDNGTDTTKVTGIALAASTPYLLQIKIDKDRVPHYLIDGKKVSEGVALGTGHDLLPFIGVECDGATAAKSLTVHGLWMSKVRNA